ncbi:hypothetical protein ABBQ32_010891 [Trebouxia sp. C0010 RCD-2024]
MAFWHCCFRMHQDQSQHSSDTRQTQQGPQQHRFYQSSHRPTSARVRPEPNERDKQAAEALKMEGNLYFGKAKYGAAIEKYTEALTLCPDWSVLLVNRAMCQKKKEAWSLVQQDAEAALFMDSKLLKAHYLLGMALRHAKQLPESVFHLRQALDLARESNDNIKDEIWHELAQVEFMHWEDRSAQQLHAQQQLQQRMQQVLQLQYHQEATGAQGAPGNVQQDQQSERAALDQVFQAAKQKLTPGEPASAFTCPLTMEVFRDPVMTPSGLSYERSALLEHIRKVGAFDPITRQKMTAGQLVTNIALRSATLQYLDEHPWAWAECC